MSYVANVPSGRRRFARKASIKREYKGVAPKPVDVIAVNVTRQVQLLTKEKACHHGNKTSLIFVLKEGWLMGDPSALKLNSKRSPCVTRGNTRNLLLRFVITQRQNTRPKYKDTHPKLLTK